MQIHPFLAQRIAVWLKLNVKIWRRLLLVLFLTSMLGACASHPPFLNPPIILENDFIGDWFVIANIPYFAEQNRVESKTTYIKINDRRYQDIFSARKGGFNQPLDETKGVARSLNDSNTEWLSVFYWVVRFRFSVIHMSSDKQWMLLGHRNRDYGWLMARENSIDAQTYQQAMAIFKRNGYDPDQFLKVPQYPEQVGKPGFHTIE